ncbi:hypothetical protein TeGR_g7330 [Tetraparma gracilis]|uniref:Leucine rich repeat protein n=1 Tax=Tetraparma gracilis TaxID=2962635 RepID=A0ABQ6MLI5_9STRA|nr:hypothetical protein TeGR_g7330 [Tetraparma gracilis]
MSKAVVYEGSKGEFLNDEEVTDVTVADGIKEIVFQAFGGCKGLTNLSFLQGSVVTTVGRSAFNRSGIASLQGMERVSKIGIAAFAYCKDLRTIEGLGCEEMGIACFAECTLLQSMKGWPASMTVIPEGCFFECTGMTTVDCDLSRVTSIGRGAFAGCTSLLPLSLSKADADPAAVLAFLKRKAFLETPAGLAELESAARAAEDSLLAELDAEDAAKKGGKKKKKKKKASGKKGKGEEQAEPADWRTDFQRYVQSDMMRGVDQRKRQRNLEEAARVMAAHEQKIAALRLPPSIDPPSAPPPAAPDALKETTEDIEAQIAALGLASLAAPGAPAETAEDIEAQIAALPPPSSLEPALPAAPDAFAETAEDIDAQIAALGPPPNFSPAPPPAAAPDAFLESLLAAAPPAPHAPPQSRGKSHKETVAELHHFMFGADPPPGATLLAVVEKLEGELGYVGTGSVVERINNVKFTWGV